MADLDLIVCDPRILRGKPTVRGTRLSVEFLLGLFADGWTHEQVLESYPSLTPEALRAVFAYAAEVLGKQPPVPSSSIR
jgi:uncharacterized protein (DUF433 family)